MKRISLLLVCAVIIAVFSGCSPANKDTENSSTPEISSTAYKVDGESFTSEKMGISFDIPIKWKVTTETVAFASITSPVNPADNIAISSTPGAGSPIVSMTKGTYEKQLEAAGKFKITSFEKSKVDGYDAITAEVKITVQNTSITQHTCMIDNNGTLITIIYTSASGDLSDSFERSVASLKFAK